jgi:hypothetical protein
MIENGQNWTMKNDPPAGKLAGSKTVSSSLQCGGRNRKNRGEVTQMGTAGQPARARWQGGPLATMPSPRAMMARRNGSGAARNPAAASRSTAAPPTNKRPGADAPSASRPHAKCPGTSSAAARSTAAQPRAASSGVRQAPSLDPQPAKAHPDAQPEAKDAESAEQPKCSALDVPSAPAPSAAGQTHHGGAASGYVTVPTNACKEAAPASTSKKPTALKRQGTGGLLTEDDTEVDRKEQALARMIYQETRAAVLRGEKSGMSTAAVAQSSEGAAGRMLRSVGQTVAVFILYVAIAVVVLETTEEWSHADCAYFAIVTLTTVGYGDLTPQSDHGKVISMLLSVGGLVTVTGTLNNLVNLLAQERKRSELASRMQQFQDDASSLVRTSDGKDGNDSRSFQKRHSFQAASGHLSDRPSTQFGIAVSNIAWALGVLRPLLVSLVLGTCVGYYIEGWRLIDSSYFALISFLTVGYGDFAPATRTGRTLCTLFLPFACAAALRSITVLGGSLSFRAETKTVETDEGLDDKLARMKRLLAQSADTTHGLVSECDFVCSTLTELGLVDAESLGKVREQFYRLDHRSVGHLSMEHYNRMVRVKKGGARSRWLHAASLALKEVRVTRVADALSASTAARSGEMY